MKKEEMFDMVTVDLEGKTLRMPTEEELEKFKKHLCFVAKEYYPVPKGWDYDTVEVEGTYVWWYTYCAATEYTLKDLKMDGIVIRIKGKYDWGRDRDDEIFAALVDGKMVVVMGNTMKLTDREEKAGWMCEKSYLKFCKCGPIDWVDGWPVYFDVCKKGE